MKRSKLIMSLLTCCFALSVLVFGVYAMILDVQFSLSGKIQFEVDNIAQVNTLQVVVKDEDGSVFKTYDEKTINKNGSDMGKGTIDQSIGDVEAYTNQTVEIHIRVQSLTEKYVKIYLTHNEITNNTDYTKEGVKVRTNSVILAPKSDDGEVKEFIIYVQYIDLGNTIQEYTLDNNFIVHFEEKTDLLQEDTENEYWYVEMGTIPTPTGSEYIRWRYFTSYIDPEEDGSVNQKAQYTYQPGVRPEPNEDGTGCFILETDTTNVIRWDGEVLNYCNFCNEFIFDQDISDITKKYHKTGDLQNVLANDYATSQIRDYINGIDVYKTSKRTSDGYTFDEEKDKSNMFKDFYIDENDYIFSTMIKSRTITDLYAKNKFTQNYSSAIEGQTFGDQDLPKDINDNILHENDSDNFWLLSFWEAYFILGAQTTDSYNDENDKIAWYDGYPLRSAYPVNSDDMCAISENSFTDDVVNEIWMARAAFKMTF